MNGEQIPPLSGKETLFILVVFAVVLGGFLLACVGVGLLLEWFWHSVICEAVVCQ